MTPPLPPESIVAPTAADKATHSIGNVSVIIPVFNEAAAVASVVEEVRSVVPVADIIVIDDGSTDGSAEAARAAAARVFAHHGNIGYGAALKTGLRAAANDIIVIIDGDGTYPASEIPTLLAQLEGADMVVAARTGNDVNVPIERRPAKWLLTRVAEFLAYRRIPDLNSGMRAFRRSDSMRFFTLFPSGFSFTTTLTLAYLSNDLIVRYVPISYRARDGQSKFRPVRDTKNLIVTMMRSILFFNPLRVCIPLSLLLFSLAFGVLLFLRDSHGNIYDGAVTVLAMSGIQVLMLGFIADVISRMR